MKGHTPPPILAFLVLPFTGHLSAAAPVRVFILAGQSNMEGKGVVSHDDAQLSSSGRGNLVWSMAHSPGGEMSPNPGHGHHGFGNAESYFLVGDALGRAAVRMPGTVGR